MHLEVWSIAALNTLNRSQASILNAKQLPRGTIFPFVAVNVIIHPEISQP
jgi:hypothetical protein